jgi:hypothetical protein
MQQSNRNGALLPPVSTLHHAASGIPPKREKDANILFDHLKHQLGAKNDAALCRLLCVQAPTVSKIRHGKLPVPPWLLIRIHEVSGLAIRELRTLMGDLAPLYLPPRSLPDAPRQRRG